jgi:hypothetical protein
VPRWVRHTRRRLENIVPKRSWSHVQTKFGQFLKCQRNVKLVHEQYHAKVLTMVQPRRKNMDLVLKKFNHKLNAKMALSLGFQTWSF